MDGLEYSSIYAKARFVARPDRENPRTCDSVGQQFPGIVKNGKFTLIRTMSIDENYRKSVESYGLSKVYNLK